MQRAIAVLSSQKTRHSRPESSADKADKTQHAYDPISDMEAEQEYRDSTEITPGKVLFSVLSYHAEGEESAYLDDDSDICAEYDLKDVEFILETKAENTAEKDGMTPYKTFYEATTSEDVWATVDKLSDNETFCRLSLTLCGKRQTQQLWRQPMRK